MEEDRRNRGMMRSKADRGQKYGGGEKEDERKNR